MDAERWERIQELFHEAVALPQAEQRAWLEAHCADESLRADVVALLDEDARGSSVLDRDVAQVANEMFENPHSLDGRTFGAYRIKGVLGEGGMGVVYLAERPDLGNRVAIKILRDAWISPARRERFAAEQRTLAQLTHPSIARLYDAGSLADGTPWFVMEYIEGVPITDYCRARAATIPERLRLFRQVCEAVLHAHRHLVIHRDLKPSNVLVQNDGTVKLLDFGIAKQLDGLDVPVDQTRTSVRLMTPAYAAPEQMRGERVGLYTDVFTLGVVLYELLVGRLPFDLSNKSPIEAEAIILGRDAEKPSSAAARMVTTSPSGTSHIRTASRSQWADLDVLCLTAMQKDLQRRYRTVEALIRDVDHYQSGQPLEARPDSARYRAGKFLRRNWRPVAASTFALLLIVGVVGFYTVRLGAARNSAVAEAARTQRIQRFTLDLFSGGDEEAGPPDSLRVVTLVDRGVRQARTLDAEPVVQTELYRTLGGIYQKLGRLERADSLLSLSLARNRSRYGPQHQDVAANLIALGLLRSDQARFDEAEQTIRQALDLYARLLPPDHPARIEAIAALGRVLEARGKYDEAIPVFENVVQVHSRSLKESAELAGSLYQLASVHYYAGHYPVADSLNQRVLGMYRRLYGDRHPLVSATLVNLGAVQHEQGNYEEAVRYYQQAIEISRAWHGEHHPTTAANLTMLARSYLFMQRYDEAADLLNQSLAIRERVYGKVHPAIASTVNELGSVALSRARYDEAEAAYRRMIDIYRQVYNGKHFHVGVATSNLASVYTAKADYRRAEELFRQAIAIYNENLEPDHMTIAIARLKLGRALLRQGRYREAERESRAGYDIVSKQAEPGLNFLVKGREDLTAIYSALGNQVEAARFRALVMADSARMKN